MRDNGRRTVEAIALPLNRGSVAFYTRLGFTIVPGDGIVDAVPFTGIMMDVAEIGSSCARCAQCPDLDRGNYFAKRISGIRGRKRGRSMARIRQLSAISHVLVIPGLL